ncbi:signal peptidase II [Haloplasma contractile]|uniref:Lipoprotein signal peptidase n=1 Tax=Haloplasma contractile SSD-17B TaxID=1033810 RepID=U2FM80_9MOLU|nr:signal peptidase II [Haloplasma contractile]ERJ13830.1 Lipoprotein signal peptidase [Haloplasma contractile SSD-17B]
MIIAYIGIIVGLVLLDQVTKFVIVHNMHLGQDIPVIGDFFSITSHRNRGAAWGMMEGRMDIFIPITILVLLVLSYMLKKDGDITNKPLFTWGILLMISGAIGNFIDRIWREEVVDFLDFYIFNYNFPVFNVADMCLTIGVGFLIVYILFFEQ